MKPNHHSSLPGVEASFWGCHLDPELNEPDNPYDIIAAAQREDPDFFSVPIDTTV